MISFPAQNDEFANVWCGRPACKCCRDGRSSNAYAAGTAAAKMHLQPGRPHHNQGLRPGIAVGD